MKDMDRFEELYHDTHLKLEGYITRNLLYDGSLPAITPEDLAQRVYAIAWQKKEKVLTLDNPLGWLIECAKRVYQTLLREEKKWSANVELVDETEDYIDIQEQVALKMLLEDEDFYVLKRHYGDKASYQEICSELQIEKSALAMRLKRAKERFRELAEKE